MEQNQCNPNITPEMKGIGGRIRSLDYVFPCNMAYTDDPESIKLFGTGGSMLLSLKRLVSNIRQLKVLKLTDLMLERYEAKHLLDEVLETNCTNLRVLHLINVTSTHCPIMHVGIFLNLQILVISPQNIDDDVLQLITDGSLKHLHLYQNRYTPDTIAACSARAWTMVAQNNPKLKIHLSIESDNSDAEIIIQPNAPVSSIIYTTPNTKVGNEYKSVVTMCKWNQINISYKLYPCFLQKITATKVVRMIDAYKNTLRIYGFKESLATQQTENFNERIDSLIVLICRTCPYLTYLVRNYIKAIWVCSLNMLHALKKQDSFLLTWPKKVVPR